ncbi:MAG TPA: cell division protein FtsB [Steroidobacteraceae bacterium]|jgi:cell division protein FtsB
MKFLLAGLVILLVLLQYRMWLGEGGMREVTRLRQEITQQRDENTSLRERNRTLTAEVQDLKKGTTAIEERARTDLGMVGQGETFFQVVMPRETPKETAAPATDGKPASGTQAATPANQ